MQYKWSRRSDTPMTLLPPGGAGGSASPVRASSPVSSGINCNTPSPPIEIWRAGQFAFLRI